MKKQKQKTTEPRYFLSRGQLAKRWFCSTETIKRREKARVLPSLRLGGLVRYKLADIERIEAEAGISL